MQITQNIEMDEKRIIVENLFAFTRSWAICYQKLRYKTSDLDLMLARHNRNFRIVWYSKPIFLAQKIKISRFLEAQNLVR